MIASLLQRAVYGLIGRLRRYREARLISPHFDLAFYINANSDVEIARIKPLTHYMVYGWKEGRSPSAEFDTSWYLSTYADVAESGVNPLTHYILHGVKEGREPKPPHDQDVVAPYILHGDKEGREPKPPQDQDVVAPFFDKGFYLTRYADLMGGALDPLAHYLSTGWLEGKSPSPAFDTVWYLARYPDVAASGQNPLVHYALHGRLEQRETIPPPAASMNISASSRTLARLDAIRRSSIRIIE